MILSRRAFFGGVAALVVAPAFIRASSMMPISVRNLGYDLAAVQRAMMDVMELRDAHGWPMRGVGADHPAHPVKRGLISLRDFRLDIVSPWKESGRGYGAEVDDDLRPIGDGTWNLDYRRTRDREAARVAPYAERPYSQWHEHSEDVSRIPRAEDIEAMEARGDA